MPRMNFEDWDVEPWHKDQLRRTKWVPADEFRRLMGRRASIHDYETLLTKYEGDDFAASASLPDVPVATWFGDVQVGLPGEEWPYNGTTPLMPLFQFNLAELPFCPETLSDIALITIFIDAEDMPIENYSNGNKWVLRAYPNLEDLVPLQKPAGVTWGVTPFRPLMKAVDDFPSISYALGDVLPLFEHCTSWSDYHDEYSEAFENHSRAKIGGWPYDLQNGPSWGAWRPDSSCPPDLDYAFQIDGIGEWSWGDAGIAWFGRGMTENRHIWMLDWTCC